MGKVFVIVVFLVCLITAMYIALSKKPSPRSRLDDLDRLAQPGITLVKFQARKYDRTSIKNSIRANRGDYLEPNRVHLSGKVRIERTNRGRHEIVNAESALMYFSARSISEMLSVTDLNRAELKDRVRVEMGTHTLLTDYAEYIGSKDIILSPRPLRVVGPGKRIEGNQGFEYDVNLQELSILGQIQGVMQPDVNERSH